MYTDPNGSTGVDLTASTHDFSECLDYMEGITNYAFYVSMGIVLRMELKFGVNNKSMGSLAAALVDHHKNQTQATRNPKYHINCTHFLHHTNMLSGGAIPNPLKCISYRPPLAANVPVAGVCM